MAGFSKTHPSFSHRRKFPASRYVDPRGGRPSAIERNVLRYRAIEATLYLFYADEVRAFMTDNVYPRAKLPEEAPFWEPIEERRLTGLLAHILMDAETRKLVSPQDSNALQQALASEHKQGKKLNIAFGYAVSAGMFTEREAQALRKLLDYRNDIAHRIHLVMADVTRTTWNAEALDFAPPIYKGDALDHLRRFTKTLWRRASGKLITQISMNPIVFEMAARVYEDDLKRLDGLIRKQVSAEVARVGALNAELDLSHTELIGDLAPDFYYNHRPSRTFGDDYIPPTGHLTARGVEICYRLYDLGKSPIAVAYLMRITLRSAERRKHSWTKAGGLDRTRAEVVRYDLSNGRLRRALSG